MHTVTETEARGEKTIKKYLAPAYLQRYGWAFVRGVLIIEICVLILYPLLIKLSTSLMTERDLYDLTVNWIPRYFSLDTVAFNYRTVFWTMNYPTAFLNSLTLTLLVSLAQLISCTIIGYGFARFEFRGNNFLFGLVIFTLLVPPQMMMIPLFLNFRFFDFFGMMGGTGLNLIGTYWPFALTALTGTGMRNGLFIYIMRQHFKCMPRDLEEAAYVDGAGQFKTFYKIMLPGAVPVIIIVFLFSFVWQWNDTFLTSLYMRERAVLLPFELGRLASEYAHAPEDEFLTVVNNTGMLMFLAPLLFLYAGLQRYFLESVQRTGIVG